MRTDTVNQTKSVKFNFIMNSILTMSSMLFPLITYPYVTRVLGTEGVGTVDFANANISYFLMVAQLGVPTYGIRACAQVRDDRKKLTRTFQEIMIINLITCLIAYGAFAAALILVPQFRQERTLFLVMGSSILFNTVGVEWLYKGLEQYSYITARALVFKVLALFAVFLFLRGEEDYILYGGILIFASVGSGIMNLIALHRHVNFKPVGDYQFGRHLKPIFVFFAMSAATTIYTNMDSVMLGFISGTHQNGIYAVAVKAKGVLVALITSLGTVLMPRVSYYLEVGRKDEFTRISIKALNFVVLVSFSLCLYFILFAAPTIDLLGGNEFVESVLPMRIIMPTLILIGLTNIIGLQMLVPMGREKQVLYSEIVGAVINIIVNSALIPSMGAAGAAAGTLAAEFAVLVVQVIVLREQVLPALQSIRYDKFFLALAAAAAASFWMVNAGLGSFLTLLLSAVLFFAVYGGVLLLLKEKMMGELLMQIKEMIRKVRRV